MKHCLLCQNLCENPKGIDLYDKIPMLEKTLPKWVNYCFPVLTTGELKNYSNPVVFYWQPNVEFILQTPNPMDQIRNIKSFTLIAVVENGVIPESSVGNVLSEIKKARQIDFILKTIYPTPSQKVDKIIP